MECSFLESVASINRTLTHMSVSLMNPAMGGPAVKPYQPKGIWAEATFGKIKYKPDQGDKFASSRFKTWTLRRKQNMELL